MRLLYEGACKFSGDAWNLNVTFTRELNRHVSSEEGEYKDLVKSLVCLQDVELFCETPRLERILSNEAATHFREDCRWRLEKMLRGALLFDKPYHYFQRENMYDYCYKYFSVTGFTLVIKVLA